MRAPRAAPRFALLVALTLGALVSNFVSLGPLGIASGPTAAHAQAAKSNTKLRLDRAVAEPSVFPGYARLKLYATAVTLQGGFIPLTGKKAFALAVNGSRKSAPYLMGAFGGTAEPLVIAIVLHRGFEYSKDWNDIKAAFIPFLGSLPKDAMVSIITYADTVETSRLRTPSAAAKQLATLTPDPAPAANQLIKAVERATRILDKSKTKEPTSSARKFIILLSDGKDLDPQPKRFRKVGEKAAKKGIRIHSVAFSPDDNRRPLLGLGELSKRSLGTFRWVRASGLFGSQFEALAAEVAKQYVLTFFVKPKLIDKKKVSLLAGDAKSNAIRVKVECGGETCSANQYCGESKCVTRRDDDGVGILGWLLYIIGGLVGALLLLAIVGYFMTRSGSAPVPMPGVPGAEVAGAMPAPPGQAPPGPASSSHRIVAYGSQGQVVGGGAPQTGVQAAVAAPRHVSVYIVNGPRAGQTISIAHGATIGSHPSCQIHLAADGFTSSVHAQLLADTKGNFSIVDKGSTNGTFVNGVRTQQHRLAHGNTIKIGGVELRFLVQ